MSAASHEPQRSVIKLPCLWQFLLQVAFGDFRCFLAVQINRVMLKAESEAAGE